MKHAITAQDFPHIGLAQLPTPLERLERLSEYLGTEIWMKRDDLTGFAAGGNKVRKLEYLMAAALAEGADCVLTSGALQSNHARQTAAAAAKLGMKPVLVLSDAVAGRTETYACNGNLALDRLTGAEIIRVPAGEPADPVIARTVSRLQDEGHRVYVVPVGGSNVVGSLGYMRAATELEEQCSALNLVPEMILTASGSAGTQAGLVLGTEIPVLGVSVSASVAELSAKISAIVTEGARLTGQPALTERPILVDDGFVGSGYGQPTEAMSEALHLVGGLEGIFLDPVYSGKAMAGLISRARARAFTGPVIFLHTGGMPGIFAYDDVL